MCGFGVDNYESIQRNRLKVKKCVRIRNYGKTEKNYWMRYLFNIWYNPGRGKCYQLSRDPKLIMIVLLYMVLKKIRTNTASHGRQF